MAPRPVTALDRDQLTDALQTLLEQWAARLGVLTQPDGVPEPVFVRTAREAFAQALENTGLLEEDDTPHSPR